MALTATLKRIVLLAAFACAAVVVVDATQAMQRPGGYKEAPHNVTTAEKTETKIIHKRAATGMVQMGYFTNWAIYSGYNFQPTDINPTPLTHILYSFANVSPDTGAISLTDLYADEEKLFPGDDASDTSGTNLYGCLKQMYLLKLQQRNLKVLLSIGGYTYSQDGNFAFLTDATKRATFVSNAVSLIEDYGFDGIDIDYEYPANSDQESGFAALFTSLRSAFDTLQSQKGDANPYLITAAVSAGASNYAYLDVPTMNAAIDYWNLMAYDYAGSWLTYADNQANLYGGERTGVSTDQAVKAYVATGATASKIVMGIPAYGRAFEQTTGIGAPYNGVGPGSVEAGVYMYKDLPLAGATVYENLTDVSSYSYDSATEELVSYDTPTIATIKAQYVQNNGLAGSMFWDLSQDKQDSESLVSTTANVYGTLDQTQNHIDYPNSKWANIRNNMGQGSTSSVTTSSTMTSSASTSTTPTTTTTTTATTTSPTGGSGPCATVSAWSSTTTYVGGDQAAYNGDLWTAQWWTLGDLPGSSVGVWLDDGAC